MKSTKTIKVSGKKIPVAPKKKPVLSRQTKKVTKPGASKKMDNLKPTVTKTKKPIDTYYITKKVDKPAAAKQQAKKQYLKMFVDIKKVDNGMALDPNTNKVVDKDRKPIGTYYIGK